MSTLSNRWLSVLEYSVTWGFYFISYLDLYGHVISYLDLFDGY
jgi:hypothetical protein